jgi:hypothetical protein
MRRLFAFFVAFAVAAAPAGAATPLRPGQLGSAEAVLGWLNKYRAKPEPAQVPEAVKAMSTLGAFKDPDNAGVYVGFIAGVIGVNEARADDLIARMVTIAPEDHWVIVRAIAYSSHPDWKGLLTRFADRMPTRRKMIDRHLAGRLPILTQISFADPPGTFDKIKDTLRVDKYFADPPPKKTELPPSPGVLDTLWGYYFATGAFGPVARIVLMLPWSKDKDDVERLTVGSMAKFTLATNAARDHRLLAMLQAMRADQPKAVQPVLAEVIEAAETVETGKVRKEALAALEELKRKGPMSRRNVVWWGQMGEGAIAVGCIAAAAVGTVALGLPCVVGGAVTSAGLRYLGSE